MLAVLSFILCELVEQIEFLVAALFSVRSQSCKARGSCGGVHACLGDCAVRGSVSRSTCRNLVTVLVASSSCEERRCKTSAPAAPQVKMASPVSAQQRSAKESRSQFDRRMLNMVSLLKSTDTLCFHKKVSKSMATEAVKGPFAYSLFPIDFIKQHSKKFSLDVTFALKDSQRTWPIKLSICTSRRSPPRVFAYGSGGWKTFLMDNQIKVGDRLFFTLVSFSTFQVVIHRAPVEDHSDADDDHNEAGDDMGMDMDVDTVTVTVTKDDGYDAEVKEDEEDDDSSAKWFRNTSPWWDANQAPVLCRACKLPCPRFLVTIRPSPHTGHLSLAVPGRFWELHGNMLESDELLLRGPNEVIFTVKAKRIYDVEEGKLSVCLESGWEAFVAANELRVGDNLEFFLVGSSFFTVDVMEKYEFGWGSIFWMLKA